MATPKISAPNPAAFNSDPIEQIYARGVLDRDMSGLSFMLANAAQDRGDKNAGIYMKGVDAANQQAMVLSREEEMNKRFLEILKGSLDLAKNGYQPANMPALNPVFNDVNAADVREPSSAANALLRAKAQQALAGGSGGGGGGDRDEVTLDVSPLGTISGKIVGKSRGGDPDAKSVARALALQKLLRQGGSMAPTSQEDANKIANQQAEDRYKTIRK